MSTKKVKVELSYDNSQGTVLDEIEFFKRSFPRGSHRSDLSCPSTRSCGGTSAEDPYFAPFDGTRVTSSTVPRQSAIKGYYEISNILDHSIIADKYSCKMENYESCYYMADTTGNQRIDFEFPMLRYLHFIRLYPKTIESKSTHYRISILNEAGAWVDLNSWVYTDKLQIGGYFDHPIKAKTKHVRLYLKPESVNDRVSIDEIQFYGEKTSASSEDEQVRWLDITGGVVKSSTLGVGDEQLYSVERSVSRLRVTVTGTHVFETKGGKCKGDCILHTKSPYNLATNHFDNQASPLESAKSWCSDESACQGVSQKISDGHVFAWSHVAGETDIEEDSGYTSYIKLNDRVGALDELEFYADRSTKLDLTCNKQLVDCEVSPNKFTARDGTIVTSSVRAYREPVKETVAWTHILTAGCNNVLTTGKTGNPSDSCWKGYTDDEINDMVVNSEFQIVFSDSSDRKTMYIQLTETDGSLRNWKTASDVNPAKWKWTESEAWKGPCHHTGQSYNWFHFKTSYPAQNCESSNYENGVTSDSGFFSNDGSNFWPTTGWSSSIKMYAKTGGQIPSYIDNSNGLSRMFDNTVTYAHRTYDKKLGKKRNRPRIGLRGNQSS
jgi:hypothetical protein